jgi:hypothetical protein
MEIKNRIKGLRQVKASELLPNPKNWRTHPTAQTNALRGVLAEIGYADALIAYETPDGLMLIDGHLRAETTPDMEVPVLITDLNEEEANKLLLTLDPLASMAEANTLMFDELKQLTAITNTDIQEMLDAITGGNLKTLQIMEESKDNPYSKEIRIPVYTPTGPQPSIEELRDRKTADVLISEIHKAELPDDIEEFLLDAAERHVGFNYEHIANYYAYAPTIIQELMERSALVIIDYDKAIAQGFIRLIEDTEEAFFEDYPHAR